MSFGKRLRLIFEMKGNAALDAVEDPTQVMNLSYEKQLEQLQNLRRAIAQVMTEEKHIELLEQQSESQADHLTAQAQQALQRKEALIAQVNGYKTQMAQLQGQEAHLADVESKVEARVNAFKSQKDMLSAQYGAAQASVGANEAVTGLSSEMGDMNMAMQRAQDKVLQMQAHADAIDSLMASGTLNAPGEDPLDTQLRQITEAHNVDAELAAMRQQLQLPAPDGEQHYIRKLSLD